MSVEIHRTDKPFREHISFDDRPSIFRDTVTAEFDGKQIEKVFLYHNDPQDTPLASPVVIENMGGYMTIGDDYAPIAARMAQEGFLFVTHKPLRNISIHDQLHDPEHSKDVFLYTALVGRAVMQATLLHQYRHLGIDVNEADITCHSYGGPTGTLLARLSPETRNVILQDVAGVITGSLSAHVKGIRGIASDAVGTYKSMRQADDTLTPDIMAQHKDHVLDNPLLVIREGIALVQDPDITDNVSYARNEYGTKFGGVMFKQSAFFPYLLADACARKKKLFDEVVIVEDARHTEPNTEPVRNANTQIQILQKLNARESIAA